MDDARTTAPITDYSHKLARHTPCQVIAPLVDWEIKLNHIKTKREIAQKGIQNTASVELVLRNKFVGA